MQRAPRALLAQAAQSWAALAQQGSAPHRCFAHDSAMAAAVRNANCKDVPAGHASSDLSSTACHIGLNRLRDLTMRQDLCLWRGDAKTPIKELFKVLGAASAGVAAAQTGGWRSAAPLHARPHAGTHPPTYTHTYPGATHHRGGLPRG